MMPEILDLKTVSQTLGLCPNTVLKKVRSHQVGFPMPLQAAIGLGKGRKYTWLKSRVEEYLYNLDLQANQPLENSPVREALRITTEQAKEGLRRKHGIQC